MKMKTFRAANKIWNYDLDGKLYRLEARPDKTFYSKKSMIQFCEGNAKTLKGGAEPETDAPAPQEPVESPPIEEPMSPYDPTIKGDVPAPKTHTSTKPERSHETSVLIGELRRSVSMVRARGIREKLTAELELIVEADKDLEHELLRFSKKVKDNAYSAPSYKNDSQALPMPDESGEKPFSYGEVEGSLKKTVDEIRVKIQKVKEAFLRSSLTNALLDITEALVGESIQESRLTALNKKLDVLIYGGGAELPEPEPEKRKKGTDAGAPRQKRGTEHESERPKRASAPRAQRDKKRPEERHIVVFNAQPIGTCLRNIEWKELFGFKDWTEHKSQFRCFIRRKLVVKPEYGKWRKISDFAD